MMPPRTTRALTAAVKAATVSCALLACFLVFPANTAIAASDDISVSVQVESRDVYVGEPFMMQISVDGADDVSPPDLSWINDFSVNYMGGSNNSSQSISIINGRVQRNVQKAFIMSYQLTPRATGRFEIPSIEVRVGGSVYRTDPVTIHVKKPEESEDFKLRIALSRNTCYVGEPVVLTVTWYLSRDVQDFNFTAPVLDNDAFDFEMPEVKMDRNKKYFRIPIEGKEAIAEKGQGELDGRKFVTLKFDIALIPKRGGDFNIPEFIVSCESGSDIRTSRDFFNDFFNDNYSGRWGGSLKKYVVPSNSLDLHVKDLPLQGRPDGFAGQVGEIKVSTKAEPLDVSVGDPITLTITVEGPDYLGRLDIPPLSDQQDMVERFKIPSDRADGKIEGNRKVFTQTIRAKNDKVAEIPPVRIVYFDTGEEKYEIARSEPIPIKVRPTRVVTASDAEGRDSAPAGSPLEKWKEGIAFNYEGKDLLESRDAGLHTIFSDPALLIFLAVPPAVFIILLLARWLTLARGADPEARKARGAMKRLGAELRSLQPEKQGSRQDFCRAVMEAYKEFLGDKLSRRGGALTAGETEKLLVKKGLEPDLAAEAARVMVTCETGAFSGHLDEDESGDHLVRKVLETARRLDRKL